LAVKYQEDSNIFTLETKNSSYQMKIDKFGFLIHLYYGAKIQGTAEHVLTYYDRGFSGNPYDVKDDRTYSLDVLPQEYPTYGVGDYRSSALIIRNSNGSEACDLRYVRHEIIKGKYGLSGLPAVFAGGDEAETLKLIMEDRVSGVQVVLYYGVLENEDIITRSVQILNTGENEIVIEKAASACLDFIYGDYDLISFSGRHCMERNYERRPILHSNNVIGSRRGTSSHQHNPGVIIADKNTTDYFGECYGMLFVYSGNFAMEAEKDQYEQTRVLIGLQRELLHYPLAKNESFIVPETILSYSNKGVSELSANYHKCIRKHICRGKYANQPRPVLINSWEAAYFDFTGETIINLAEEAAELGIDLVVMDDGWFGKRDDDNSGLGDWVVNEKKLGMTLAELVKEVNKKGVKFGIWIEPEMVSEDSDLYRAHPDWALQIPDRNPVRSRNQLVLDFSREDVRNHVFQQICDVFDNVNIEYVKWDMNRSITDFYSARNVQGKVAYDYVLGVYDFMEKLLKRYPDILLEGCSGGGGRFDAGMLYYSPQIWCSDNSDAVDRLRIQYGTSFFYPPSTVGSHVSAVPNHQTGRNTSLNTRAVVAMAGIFGYELSLGKLSQNEKNEIKKQIVKYKKYSELILNGNYYRLSNPFDGDFGAWEFVSPDAKRVLVSAVMLEIHGNMTVSHVKLKGLKPDYLYKEEKSGKAYYGSVLMNVGLPLPREMGEYPAYQLAFDVEVN
jgi:alpha-galactosidase